MTLEGGRQLTRESANQGKRIAKAQTWHKARHTMAKKIENKAQAVENKADTHNEITQAEREAEALAIALHNAGMTAQIEPALIQLGMATTQAEHEAARPMSAKDIAYAKAAALGLDLAALKPAQAGNATLAVSLEGLARAFGKYGKHVFAPDFSNGTSVVTHEVAKQLLATGKCSLPDVLKAVRAHLPSYASTGHYNTLKRMLKAEGFSLNVWQAGFSITNK